MSLLDDLPLGRDAFEEEEPLNLRGDGPIQPYPLNEPLFPELDPMGQVGAGQEQAQNYRDVQSFESDMARVEGIRTDYSKLKTGKYNVLQQFEEQKMRPFWESTLKDPHGVQTTPTFKGLGKDDDPIKWYEERQSEIDDWFLGDEPSKAGFLNKFKQYQDRHTRMWADYDRANKAWQKADAKHTAMLDGLLSVPEHIRHAAESWKEQKPEKEMSPNTAQTVLNNTQFETPSLSEAGELTNSTRVDPRDPFTGPTTKKEKAAKRKEDLTILQMLAKEKKMASGLKKHGWLYSQMAQVAERSIYLTESEREILDIADARDKGFIKYVHGVPVDVALEKLGGKEKIAIARMVDNVGKAHAQYQRANLAFVKHWQKDGFEEAQDIMDLEREKWEKTVHVAQEMGLTNRLVMQGKSSSYLGDIANAAKKGTQIENTTEIVPYLAGVPGYNITRSHAAEFIEEMKILSEMPESDRLKEFHKASSKSLKEAAKNWILNPEVIPELAVEMIFSYGNTYLDNAVKLAPAGMGLGFLRGGPKGAVAGGALAMKANVGITSAVMEYADAFVGEMDKRGIDWQNPDVFMAAMSNPQLLSELRETPTIRSLVIGGVDQVFQGIAGRTYDLIRKPSAVKKLPNGLTAFKKALDEPMQASIRRNITAGLGELTTGSVFGGGGEALAQYLTEGQITNYDAVMAEAALEMAGPGGWALALKSLNSSFEGRWALEDLSTVKAEVLNKVTDEYGIIEDVNQGGWTYQRRRFNTAKDLLNYAQKEGMLDMDTPEGYIFSRMMGFAGLDGKVQDLGLVISDRTPTSEKNTRGAYHKGVIFMNTKALKNREDSVSHVMLHEGGHFVQDFMMAPNEAQALFYEALPDKESRKTFIAQYVLGKRVGDLQSLSSADLAAVDKAYSMFSQNEDVLVAEWTTHQMGLALGAISGVTATQENATPSIKTKVQDLIKKVILGNDPNVNQFFPPEMGDQFQQVAVKLLTLMGFNPRTLEHNRKIFAKGEHAGRAGMENPYLVDLSNIENFTPEQKQAVAKLANFRSWDDIPQNWIDEAIEIWGGKKAETPTTVDESGQTSLDFENTTPAEPAILDLADPEVQAKMAEGDPQARKASETQKEGEGLDAVLASPEKKPLTSVGEALDKATKAPKEDTEKLTPEEKEADRLRTPGKLEDKLKPEKGALERVGLTREKVEELTKPENQRGVAPPPAEVADLDLPGRTKLEENKLARKRAEEEEAAKAKPKPKPKPKAEKKKAPVKKLDLEKELGQGGSNVKSIDERPALPDDIQKRADEIAAQDKELKEERDYQVKQSVDQVLENNWTALDSRIFGYKRKDGSRNLDNSIVAKLDGMGLFPTTARIVIMLLNPQATKADLGKPLDELWSGSDKLRNFFDKTLKDGNITRNRLDEAYEELQEILDDAFPNLRNSKEIVKNVLMPFGVHKIDKDAFDNFFSKREGATGTQQVWEDSAGPAPKLLEPNPKLNVEHFKDDQIEATLADGTEGTPTVKGLSRHTGVFTEKETETITKEIDWLKDNPDELHNSEWTYNKTDKRTQINFGYYYSYGFAQFIGGEKVKKPKGLLKPEDVEVEPMPSWMEEISDRLIAEGVITEADRPDSALINLYPPKKGSIPPHVDHANFDRPVITIRFKNPVDMDFGYKAGSKDATGAFRSSYARKSAQQQKSNIDPFSVGLGVGEVHVMSGEAANNTTHAIFQDSLPDDGWSYSITLRQVKTDLNISENTAQGYEGKKAAGTQDTGTQAAGSKTLTIKEDIGEVGHLVNLTAGKEENHKKPEGAYAWRIISKSGGQSAEFNERMEAIEAQIKELKELGVFKGGKIDPKNPIWQKFLDSTTAENTKLFEGVLGNVDFARQALLHQIAEFEGKLHLLEGTPDLRSKGEKEVEKDRSKKPQAYTEIQDRLELGVRDGKLTREQATEEMRRIQIRWQRDTQGAVWNKKNKKWEYTGKPVDRKLLGAYRYDFKTGKWKYNKMAALTSGGTKKVLSEAEKKGADQLKSNIKAVETTLKEFDKFVKELSLPEVVMNKKGDKETVPSKLKRTKAWMNLVSQAESITKAHEKRLADPRSWYYGLDTKYELEPVTEANAREDLNWLDLPVSHLHGIPGRNKFSNSYKQHMETGWKTKKYKPNKGVFAIKRQYISIQDALSDKNSKGMRMKESIESEPPAPGVPVRELVRMISYGRKDKERSGLLHTLTEEAARLDKHQISFKQSKRIMSMIRAQLGDSGKHTSKLAIMDMQNRIKHLREKGIESIEERPAGYEKTQLPTDEEGNVVERSQLYTLIHRIEEQIRLGDENLTQYGRRPEFGADPNDMLIRLIASAEDMAAMTTEEMLDSYSANLVEHYHEGTAVTTKGKVEAKDLKLQPDSTYTNELYDAFREGDDEVNTINFQGGERPTQSQLDEIHDFQAALDVMSHQTDTKDTKGDVRSEMEKGGSTQSKDRKISREQFIPIEPATDAEISRPAPPERDKDGNLTWEYQWLNGLSELADAPDYDYVRSIRKFLKEFKKDKDGNPLGDDIADAFEGWEYHRKRANKLFSEGKSQLALEVIEKAEQMRKIFGDFEYDHVKKVGEVVGGKTFPDAAYSEVQLIDVPTSKIQDTRFANWHNLLPVVVINWLEKNGLANLLSMPDKNRAKNLTQGGLAGGWIWETKAINKAINHYGKLTKGKAGVPDAGITAEEIAKRGAQAFDDRLKLFEQQYESAVRQEAKGAESRDARRLAREKEAFIDIFGNPALKKKDGGALVDKDGNPTERLKVARKSYIQSYAAQWLRVRGAQAGGVVSSQQLEVGKSEVSADDTTVTNQENTDENDQEAQQSAADVKTEEGAPLSAVDSIGSYGIDPNREVEKTPDDAALAAELKSNPKIFEKLMRLTDTASLSKLAGLSDVELLKQSNPILAGMLKNQETTPDSVREALRWLLSPDQLVKHKDAHHIEFVHDFLDKRRKDSNKGKSSPSVLGSEIALVSEMPSLLKWRHVAAFRAASSKWLGERVDERTKKYLSKIYYSVRVNLANQHATLEDLSIRLNRELGLRKDMRGADFFDVYGLLIPTFAKTKIASRHFVARYKKPFLDKLEKTGLTDEQSGLLFQLINVPTTNTWGKNRLKEAREHYDNLIKKAENQKEGTEKESEIKKIDEEIAEFKRLREAFEEKNYEIDGEFAYAGYTNKEAAETIKDMRPKLDKLLEGDDNVLGLWQSMNARTISVQYETGQITFLEAIKLISTSIRAKDGKGFAKHVKRLLDIDPKKLDEDEAAVWKEATEGKISEDGKKTEKSIFEKMAIQNKEAYEFALENDLPPEGYFYAPMRGFHDNPYHYEDHESLDDLINNRGMGSKGWNAPKSNKVSDYKMGRRQGKGENRPDPRSAIPHAFLAHDEAVMRGARAEPGVRVREFYEMFLELKKHEETITNDPSKIKDIEWSDKFTELIKANQISQIIADPHKLKILFTEFDSFFEVHKEAPDGVMPKVEKIHPVMRSTEDSLGNKFTRLVFRKGDIPLDLNDKSLFLVKEKGKLQFVKFKIKDANDTKGARLVGELGGMHSTSVPAWMSPINTFTRFLSQTFTSWNPDFIVSNAVKDALGAAFNLTEDGKSAILKDVKKAMTGQYGKILKSIYTAERSEQEGLRSKEFSRMTEEEALKKIDDNDWKSWFLFFEAHGMRTAFTAPDSETRAMNKVRRQLNNPEGAGFRENLARLGDKFTESDIVKTVEAANVAVENAIRLVVAKSLLKNKKTKYTVQQAVMAGRNITVDFNRKGRASSLIGSLYVFFNAGVQGNLRFLKSLALRPEGHKISAGIILASVVYGVAMRMATVRDEDEEKKHGPGNWYDDHSNFNKSTKLILHPTGGKSSASISLPWGANLLWALGQRIANVISQDMGLGGSGPIENGTGYIYELYSTLNPIGGSYIPSAIAPVADVMRNENFWGGTISQEPAPFDKNPDPGAYREKLGTRQIFVDMARGLNEFFGGDEITPGTIRKLFDPNTPYDPEEDFAYQMSGSDWEHIFDGYTGGVGATLLRILSGADSLTGEAPRDLKYDDINFKEVPIARRFWANETSPYSVYNRYNRLVTTTANTTDQLKKYKSKKIGNGFVKKNAFFLKLESRIKKWETQRKVIQAKERRIRELAKQKNWHWVKEADMLEPLEMKRVAEMRKILDYANKLGHEI